MFMFIVMGAFPTASARASPMAEYWIDAPDAPPKHISGKCEIKLKRKFLESTFTARRRVRKPPLPLCM